jgi:signal transduction histidine kinase
MRVTIAPASLDRLVQEVVDELQGAIRGRPLSLTAEIPPALAAVPTDAIRLRQILINIVGNAIKFTAAGTIRVGIVVETRSRRPIRIDVIDTGIGIPPDRLEAIFAPFEQAEGGTTRRFDGTGLGLAISKSLAEMLGCSVEVQSRVGAGSTFSIVLPRTADGVTDDAPPTRPAALLEAAAVMPGAARPSS